MLNKHHSFVYLWYGVEVRISKIYRVYLKPHNNDIVLCDVWPVHEWPKLFYPAKKQIPYYLLKLK